MCDAIAFSFVHGFGHILTTVLIVYLIAFILIINKSWRRYERYLPRGFFMYIFAVVYGVLMVFFHNILILLICGFSFLMIGSTPSLILLTSLVFLGMIVVVLDYIGSRLLLIFMIKAYRIVGSRG